MTIRGLPDADNETGARRFKVLSFSSLSLSTREGAAEFAGATGDTAAAEVGTV